MKTVAKSMLRQGLEGISPKKFTPVTTIPGVDTYKIPDRVKRGWDQGGSTASGFQTSPTCAPVRAGCTWRQSPMRIPDGSWAGR